MASKTRRPPNKTRRPEQTPRKSPVARVMSMPRNGRIAVVGASMLIFAFAMWFVIASLFTRLTGGTIHDPAILWIVVILSLANYFAGYVYIIGVPGETPPAGRLQTLYLLVTAILAVVSTGWAVTQAATAFGT